MNREVALAQIGEPSAGWDVLVIGGGATGLGCAVDATSRGCRTVLIEQADFAQGTSSRSTKLIHGGFRYLKQGNLSLVRHSLRERGLLLMNAPHLVRPLSFVLPHYAPWERPYYGFGLKLYDWLAGRQSIGHCRPLTREETLAHLPGLAPERLRGGTRYLDGQFDDARLAVCLAQTLFDLGGIAINHFAATTLLKEHHRVVGVLARDQETGREYLIRARAVINATGIFADTVRRMDDPGAAPMIRLSQGAHLILPSSFLPGPNALMVPKTDDGRILFAIPWHDRLLVGTTDIPGTDPVLEPHPLPEEIEFLLEHAGRYLARKPESKDILSAFCGLRPLVSTRPNARTPRLARDHVILLSPSGLITVTGGKWTTYRQMAQQTVDRALQIAGLAPRPSRTQTLHLHGWRKDDGADHPLSPYGSDLEQVRRLTKDNPAWEKPIHPRLPDCCGDVVWAARHEMARTVEDVLARRTRSLLLDARAALEAAPATAQLLAAELKRDKAWQASQLAAFTELAHAYIPTP